MRYLLDTHIVIWAMVGSNKLSEKAALTLRNPENELYVSPISVLEVAIKHAIRPDEIPVTAEQVVRFCRNSGIIELPVGFMHSQAVAQLPQHHNDPFDRVLVAQASSEEMLLLTHDGKLPHYGDFVVSV